MKDADYLRNFSMGADRETCEPEIECNVCGVVFEIPHNAWPTLWELVERAFNHWTNSPDCRAGA